MIKIQMIFLYLWIVNTNALYAIHYFKQMNKTNKTCKLCTRSNQFQRERIATPSGRQKGWYPEAIRFYDQLISGIMSPYHYLASTEDMEICGIFYA
jgi:hypothetical protein